MTASPLVKTARSSASDIAAVEPPVAQPVLLHPEEAGIGELALDRLDVGRAEPRPERARRRGSPRRAARAERADADAVQERRHLLRRAAAEVPHHLGQRLGEARAAAPPARRAPPRARHAAAKR